ncbi:helix-turn-helix domain-containing protein [Rhizobium gallicum]
MVAETLKIAPRAAVRIIEEPGLREMTGRGRFRGALAGRSSRRNALTRRMVSGRVLKASGVLLAAARLFCSIFAC